MSPSLSESDVDEQPGTASQHGNGNRQFNNFGTGPQKNVDGNYFGSKGDQHFVTKNKAFRVIPSPRNEDVINRAHIFNQLDALLPPTSEYQSGALWGLGGSGKTQVALEYAYRRSRDPACSVFWVHADNETTFTQDYKAIAKRLGLAGGLDGPELLMAVRERIEAGSCWLLILDNADNLTAFGVGQTQPGKDQGRGVEEKYSLYDFVPRGSAGTVLWTSRDKRIGGSLVGAKRAINVARMTDAEAMALLETVGNRKIGEGERDGCRIHAEDIDSEDDDNEVLHAAIQVLQEFSFLHLRASEGTSRAYEMHKLVQDATQYALSRRDRREDEVHFSKLALRVVTDLFPERRRELWGECEKYVVHAQRAGEWAELCEGEIEASGLLSRVSNYMYDRGRWREKEPVDKRAYEFGRKRLGEKHPNTIWSMASLATTYRKQGRYEEAEKISVEVLALRRDVLGEKLPDTIWSMADLAATYHVQGRYEETEKIKVEVLALWRDVLGEKHPDTIRSMAELAATYHNQGKYKEAEKIFVEVLAPRRDVLGEKHPDMIRSMAELAATYHNQGKYKEAEKIFVEVLVLQRDVLGEKYPDMIRSMAELAATYHNQGKYKEAEKIFVEVLVLQRDVLGEKYPNTIWSMADLAATYHVQGRYEEAEKIKVEVLALRRDVLGEKHPDTIGSMADLATTYHNQGRYEEAGKIFVEVLTLRRDVIGATLSARASRHDLEHGEPGHDIP
ncbi:hypothetical protein B0T22DRAFT_537180 [Podospora appendiculata]|uniref:ORC1/DEAH AAA+ ATPase domain-containing protein n=1 Tax=Podospora appendiculata TaxID=314037 RepID=A0AAE0XDW3_9PEZI|nr:hypothetical protein B0T22DRAFT_537180 [Podospora appendiculata]